MAGQNKLILEIWNLKNLPNKFRPVYLKIQIDTQTLQTNISKTGAFYQVLMFPLENESPKINF